VTLVSILTPSLNQARFVRDCMVSVQRQVHAEWEHVIVDGGSSDGTLDEIRAAADERLHLHVLPGTSQAQALNAALERSCGVIIGWLNTDDGLFGTDALVGVVTAFEREPNCVAVYGDGVIVDETARVLRHVSTRAADLARLQQVSPLMQPAVFIRRRALAERFLREDVGVMIDLELWHYLAGRGRFRKVDRVLAVDRDHPSRKTQTLVHEQAKDRERLAAEYGLAVEAGRSPRRVARAWTRRASGAGELLALERLYRPAFPYRLDARWRRAARQLLLPQRALHRL